MAHWSEPYVTERKVIVGDLNQIVAETNVDLVSDDDTEVEFTQVINIEVRTSDNVTTHA